jgi:hypothetical protein
MRRIHLLYCLSGFLSLGYQVAWFRIFVDRFGSTNLTFAFVIANFIGGLGAGSLASRRLCDRLERRLGMSDRVRLYGLFELAIALTAGWTLLLPLVPAGLWGSFPYVLDQGVHQPIAPAVWAQLGLSTLCVFVPCFLMGVTFPLLCHVFRDDARFPAALYAWNTLGACAGVLACEFVLLPWLGHRNAYVVLALVNGALGAFLLALGSRAVAASGVDAGTGADPLPKRNVGLPTYARSVALTVAVLSGAVTGAFEADVLRRVQFLDCRTGAALSCISFWAILAIFLASATVRALPRLSFGWLRIAVAVALLCYIAIWEAAYPLREWANHADNLRVRAALPPLPSGLTGSFQFFDFQYGFGAVLWFTGIFVFPPFYLVSLLLPHVCNAAQAEGRHLGVVYGTNTLAFCAGLLAFTSVAPRANLFYAMRLFIGLFALAAVVLFALRPDGRRLRATLAVAGLTVVGLALVTPASFARGWFPSSSPAAHLPIRAMKSNGTHTTYVVGDPAGDALYFDSHSMSGTTGRHSSTCG